MEKQVIGMLTLYLSLEKLFFESLNKELINKIYYRDYPENIKKTLPEHNFNVKFNDYLISKGIFIDEILKFVL